ncbi:hypothetical protein ACOMHN_008391 [Nucella lapillus]
MTEDGVGKRDPMAKAIGPAAALVSPELLDVMNAGLDDDEVDKIGEIADVEIHTVETRQQIIFPNVTAKTGSLP